jgi:hypothetical protein
MASTKKSTTRKTTAKKSTKRTKKQVPAVSVANDNRFAPGATVGFYPAHTVELERREGREPVGKPEKTAKVKANGELEVRGLGKGVWTAMAEDESGNWHSLNFTVGLSRKGGTTNSGGISDG